MIFQRAYGILILGEDCAHLSVFKEVQLCQAFVINTPQRLSTLLRRLSLSHISLLLNPVDLRVNHIPLEPLRWIDKHRIKRNARAGQNAGGFFLGNYSHKQGLTFSMLKASHVLWAWLQVLQKLGCAVKGCYLLPVEAAALLPYLTNPSFNKDPCWTILVSRHGRYVRHSVFKNTHLLFTRYTLGPGEERAEKDFDSFCADMMHSTRNYLLKAFGASEADIHFLILESRALAPIITSFPRCSIYSLGEVQSLLKMHKPVRQVEPLFAAAFIKKRRPLMALQLSYLVANQRRYRWRVAIKGGFWGSIFIFFLMGTGMIFNSWVGYQRKQAQRLYNMSATLQRQPQALFIKPFTLEAVVFRDEQHWAFWVGGKRYTPAKPLPGFTVRAVNGHSIKGKWCVQEQCQEMVLGVKKVPLEMTKE
jgi:hypothetical protein